MIPVGPSGMFFHQELVVVTKTKDATLKQVVFPVSFVPMTGEAQKKK